MVNLLPSQSQARLSRTYYVRLATTLLSALVVVLFLGALLLTPSYLLARDEAESAKRYLSALDESAGLRERSGALSVVAELKEVLELSKLFAEPPVTADTLSAITSHVVAGVRIQKIVFGKTEEGKTSISVAGIADTRAGLLSFAEALKADATFEGVTLPVSQLAQDTDIEFTLHFLVKNKTP